MSKKRCVYCKVDLAESSVIDVCDNCGNKVWGDKMFKTIVNNMTNAKEKGDLHQGLVTIKNSNNS